GGRGAESMCGRAGPLAPRRRPRQPGCLVDDGRAEPGNRPDPPRPDPRPQDGAACRARAWRAGGGGRDPRRATEPDLRVLPPRAHDRRAGRAHIALARRADHRGDRAGLPRPGADDGPAAGTCEAEDPRRGDPVPRPARPPAARAATGGARDRLPDLQRGLWPAAAGGAMRGGDPAREGARRADARRARGAGAPRPDAAARCAEGGLVLLSDQDGSLWDRSLVEEGRRSLDRALRLRRPGPYQLQAAIASLHFEEQTDWAEIEALYARLGQIAPSPVVELNRAVA